MFGKTLRITRVNILKLFGSVSEVLIIIKVESTTYKYMFCSHYCNSTGILPVRFFVCLFYFVLFLFLVFGFILPWFLCWGTLNFFVCLFVFKGCLARSTEMGVRLIFFLKVRSKEPKVFNIWPMNWNLGQAYRLQNWKFFKFLRNFSRRSQNLLFLLKVGSKVTESYCNWGSKERRERNGKGVLTAGHTRTTFSGECPRVPMLPFNPFQSLLFIFFLTICRFCCFSQLPVILRILFLSFFFLVSSSFPSIQHSFYSIYLYIFLPVSRFCSLYYVFTFSLFLDYFFSLDNVFIICFCFFFTILEF